MNLFVKKHIKHLEGTLIIDSTIGRETAIVVDITYLTEF
ncbi:hypothetical protein C8N46_109134 [Kordia periserrulae]|uniref:Uncharacterized protein n=1 Tax=Kordia periserrulae TaxID=701523 RepID=A0A2T6BTY8_9FLAO|nr:hypothetical protein C8N46_109134 [Kordia periserrulae]